MKKINGKANIVIAKLLLLITLLTSACGKTNNSRPTEGSSSNGETVTSITSVPTEASTAKAPTTEAPTTEATTEAPTTEAPTEAPTTEAPTTEATTTAVTEPEELSTITVQFASDSVTCELSFDESVESYLTKEEFLELCGAVVGDTIDASTIETTDGKYLCKLGKYKGADPEKDTDVTEALLFSVDSDGLAENKVSRVVFGKLDGVDLKFGQVWRTADDNNPIISCSWGDSGRPVFISEVVISGSYALDNDPVLYAPSRAERRARQFGKAKTRTKHRDNPHDWKFNLDHFN